MTILKEDSSYMNFDEAVEDFLSASSLTKSTEAQKLVSQIDQLSLSIDGLSYIYNNIYTLEKEGIFEGGPWSDPEKLVPQLVNGTIKGGSPHSNYEVLSELRMLYYSTHDLDHGKISRSEATDFMEEVFVHNLEFVFKEPTEETRMSMSDKELKKAYILFEFLIKRASVDGIKEKLAEEIDLICKQKPIVTRRAREIISLVKNKLELVTGRRADDLLRYYINALLSPSEGAGAFQATDEYAGHLGKLTEKQLEEEATKLGAAMKETGLVSIYHAILLFYLIKNDKTQFFYLALDLTSTGKAEYEKNRKSVNGLVLGIIHPSNAQCIYGLARMLEKGLFSRRAIQAGIDNLKSVALHPSVENRILKSMANPGGVTAKQYLIGAIIRVLGQPLGIGQGRNPTCQSARGISMWSQYAPAKLINILITAATQDNLLFRFEDKELESSKLGKGLVDKLDLSLDAVSVVLVPLLDKVYSEMMRLASGRGEDPHKWVNPALYGHWIPMGFASAYNYFFNAIQDYEGFMQIFYAALHPDYNGGQRLVYPNPVGVFVTSSRGEMVGFHAVSLLRTTKDPHGEVRAYFLNPNNEGRQDWGQGIKPAVFGNGEKPGESSLPFYQFAARIYAFHYNALDITDRTDSVPRHLIKEVEKLARGSWGKAYSWNETKRQW